MLNDGWQSIFAWGTLLFFIAVPVIGIITWIIRRLAKMKSNRRILRFSFISLWIVGWACFIGLIGSLTQDFRSGNTLAEQEIMLPNPGIGKMELTTNSPTTKFYRNNWFKLQPFEGMEDDTAFVKNVEIKILKSSTDSFKVTILKMANGRTRRYADTLANLIDFNAEQRDSLLILDKGIAITKENKFRNQRVIITVYVPVGKQVRVDKSVGWGHNVSFGGWDNDDVHLDIDEEERGWDVDVDYIMKADGLYTLDGRAADDDDNNRSNRSRVKVSRDGIEVNDDGDQIIIDRNGVKVNESPDGYRYDNNDQPNTTLDSIRLRTEVEKQRIKDSLRKVKESIDKQIDKIDDSRQNTRNTDPEPISQLQSYSLLVNID